MKKLLALALCLILALSLCAVGEITGSTYTNEDLDIFITFPSDWTLNGPKELGMPDKPSTVEGDVYFLLMAMSPEGTSNVALDLIPFNSGTYVTEDMLISAAAQNIAGQYEQLGLTATTYTEPYYLKGQQYKSLVISVNVYGMTLVQRYIADIRTNMIVEYNMTALSLEEANALMDMIQPYYQYAR